MSYAIRPVVDNPVSQLDNAKDKYRAVQAKVQEQSKKVNDIHIPICYGYTQTEGVLLFDTIGQRNNVLEQVYVLSEGPIETLAGISINGYGLDFAAIIAEQGDATCASGTVYTIPSTNTNQQNIPFNGTFEFEFVNGGESTILNANTNLKSKIDLENVAYVVVRLIKTTANPIWDDDGNPTISFRVYGKKIPPIGNKAGTLAYSNNPARIIHDYLTNATYGKNLGDANIDSTSFTAAESWYDTTANLIRFQDDMKQFQFDGIVDTSQTFISNLTSMTQNFLASLPYINNKFYLDAERPIVNDPGDIAYTFDDDNVVGDITFAYSNTKDKWNNLNVNVRDRNAYYSPQTYSHPAGQQGSLYTTYVAQDSGIPLEKTINLPFTELPQMALNIAQIMTQKVRDTYTIRWTAKPDSFQVRVGDLVELSNSRIGLTSQRIRVTKTTFNTTSMTVSFEGFKHDDAYYTYTTGRLAFIYPVQKRPNLPGPIPPEETPPVYDPPPSTGLPSPGEPGAPPVSPPDSGQPTPGETFTYNFTGVTETMDDNSRFYLGEMSYTDETTGSRTDRFDATGAQCHMFHTTSGNFFKPDQIPLGQFPLAGGLTAQFSIFDRNFDPGIESEKLYFVMEFAPRQYGIVIGGFQPTRLLYDPEVDGGFYTSVSSTGARATPQDVFQNTYFRKNRLFPDGRGNYSTRFSQAQGLFPSSTLSFNDRAPVPLNFDLTTDPFGIMSQQEAGTPVATAQLGTLEIKVFKEGRFGQANYVGKFSANFDYQHITAPDILEDSRGIYRYFYSGGPGVPRGNFFDTTVSVPF